MNKVVKIEDIKDKLTQTIEIPDFSGEGTITVRVRKPQIMKLITSGKIPNPLLPTALAMLDGRNMRKAKSEDELALEGIKSIQIYCMACLVEPTWDEIKDYITDDQMFAIFNWAIGGIRRLEKFRTERTNGTGNNDGADVPQKAERNTGDNG